MKKLKFPDTISVSYHDLQIVLLEPDVALEVGDQQGSYASREQKIYLDRSIIEEGGAVRLHVHDSVAGYWVYSRGICFQCLT